MPTVFGNKRRRIIHSATTASTILDGLDFNDDEPVFFDCGVKYLEVHFCVPDDGLLFDDSHDARFLD